MLRVLEPSRCPQADSDLPERLIVRYGYMRLLGEFSYSGSVRPRCGDKLVVRTTRGTELGEMLNTTCTQTGCALALTQEQLQQYLSACGGSEYPFSTEGKVLRIATPEDRAEADRLVLLGREHARTCQRFVDDLHLHMSMVHVESLLGGELMIFYYLAEQRVDFRQLVKQLASHFRCRVLMHQVGSRDEARLVADYETCGQHCCCRQFLKLLRPVNMSSAKLQKATLDPGKISGRCGRLKCCMRFEEQTYEQLRRNLPRTGTRVNTPHGTGVVVDAAVLAQLVKVRLDDDRVVAVSADDLSEAPAGQSADPPRRQPPAGRGSA